MSAFDMECIEWLYVSGERPVGASRSVCTGSAPVCGGSTSPAASQTTTFSPSRTGSRGKSFSLCSVTSSATVSSRARELLREVGVGPDDHRVGARLAHRMRLDDCVQQQDVVGVDQRRVDGVAMRPPEIRVVEVLERRQAPGHAGEAAQPDGAIGVVEIAEDADDVHPRGLERLVERTLEELQELVAAAGLVRVLAELDDHRANQSRSGTLTSRTEKSPVSFTAAAASAIARTATQVKSPPTLTRCAPASTISANERCGSASTLTGFVTASQTARISSDAREAGGIERVSARGLVGLEAGDRVVQIGIAADVVLGAADEHEREPEPAGGLRGGGDPLGGMAGVVEPAGRVVVLDRAAHGAGLGDPDDRLRGVLRLGAVAVLDVHRDRKIDRVGECAGVRDHLVERRLAVEPTQRERESGARRGERLEPERLHDASRAGVPRVRNEEGLARM